MIDDHCKYVFYNYMYSTVIGSILWALKLNVLLSFCCVSHLFSFCLPIFDSTNVYLGSGYRKEWPLLHLPYSNILQLPAPMSSGGVDCSSKNNPSTPSQKWLILLLFIWLFLTIARQAFDLIGKLWIPVAFNLLQLLACISGLFATLQYRFGLLVSLSISTVVSFAYNSLLLLWYANWLGVSRETAVLSAGLPFGHSFFLRHTPLCGSHFNLTISQWQQSGDCMLPYYHLESMQAGVHIVLAMLTLFFSILTLAERHRHKQQLDENKKRRRSQINAPDSTNDLSSSGYMNSSYESPVEGSKSAAAASKHLTAAPRLANSQRRIVPNCRRQNKQLSQQQPKLVQPTVDEYSSATTADLAGSSNNSSTESPSLPLPPTMPPPPTNYSSRIYARAQHTNGSTRYSKAASNNHQQQRVHSSNDAVSGEEEEYVSPSHHTKEIPYYSQPKHKLGGSLRVAAAASITDTSGYLEYLGRNEERRNSANNLTSLVSFDPKSNTLIRVREHQNSSDEGEAEQSSSDLTGDVRRMDYVAGRLNSGSQDSMPSTKAPVLISNFRASLPKTHAIPLRQKMPPPGIDLRQDPPTPSSNRSPDWTQAGIAHCPAPISTFLPPTTNNSIYECVGGHRTAPSTAFPVSQHQRQRSVTGISVATAISLTRPEVPPSSHYTSTFLGLNQERNFNNSTTFPNSSYFDARDNRSSDQVVFPSSDGNGLLV